MNFIKMMEIYSIRWSIEVFFKEAKQYLRLGKCQSRNFDAQIANITITCILYIFLAYLRRINDYESLGGLFENIKDDICEKNLAERLWELFDELLQVVITAISESGIVDLRYFRESPEYKYLKSLFEESFLSNQLLKVNNLT
ncbi:MAG: transposase [Deltaproteobacteria bacterium]|nr:transposase [Deltaproteobacteria bacterium]